MECLYRLLPPGWANVLTKPEPDWVRGWGHHNRDCRRGLLSGHNGGSCYCDDYIRMWPPIPVLAQAAHRSGLRLCEFLSLNSCFNISELV